MDAASPNGRIEHVVVLMLENRSFDHIFGFRSGVDGVTGTEFNLLDPSKPESATNPAFHVDNGAPYTVLAGQGPGHSVNATNTQLSGSKLGPSKKTPANNSGFVQSYNTELVFADKVGKPSDAVPRVVMQSFAPPRLPSINALADAFCVCDHWHAEVPGPTQANRLYMHAATSFGWARNVWRQAFDGDTIYENLQSAGYSWAVYDYDDNEVREFSKIQGQTANFKRFEDSFAADVKAGTLPNYSFIIPRFLNANGAPANSQHAPEDARYGDHLIADVYEALRANPDVWNKSVLIVTYDEHGGFYDHVVPPDAPNPDGINSPPPDDKASFAPTFAFDRLGLRVPAIIASPWIKAGTVDSTRYQHTSVLATVKKLFGLPAFLTRRDASANTFEHLFQQLDAPREDTPLTLPRIDLPAVNSDPTQPAHPANQPLDARQRDALMRAATLTESAKSPSLDELPHTQGEASAFIQKRYAEHFGPPAAAGKHRKGKGAPAPAVKRRRAKGR